MRKLIGLLLWIILASIAFSQETMPPYYWANEHIDYLKVRGYLPEIEVINRPYNRMEIAKSLLKIDSENLQSYPEDEKLVKKLMAEFKNEFVQLEKFEGSKWVNLIKKAAKYLNVKYEEDESNSQFKIGGYGSLNNIYTDKNINNDFSIHPQLGIIFNNNLFAYTNIKIFNKSDADYVGKEFGGLYAYSEQAYLTFRNSWIKAKVGRDWLQLGPGRSGQLLFSDNSRTFDQYYMQIGNSIFQFHFWGIMLDRRAVVDTNLVKYGANANRFINGHRISLNLKNRYFFALNEVVIYGGPNENWEAGLMNPLMFCFAYNLNTPGFEANIFYSFEWDVYFKNLEFYGELLIDDFQIEKESPGDLEPNELGLIAGIQWANPLNIKGALINFEYAQVRNRTYNAPVNDWEKYLHRNKVIGYYLGNNFERYYLTMQKWLRADLRMQLFGGYVRKGEGSVAGEFNKDYMNYTVEEGYEESFLFGIVEGHLQTGGRVFYKPYNIGHVELDFAYNDFDNYKNIKGKKHSEWTVWIGIWVEWNRVLGMGSGER
ncbi:MAG: capsule assembly Wzi family protein [Calditrichales bacterium]|nr:capsule assembly Wzi family protein [Calditrichales bacterium]